MPEGVSVHFSWPRLVTFSLLQPFAGLAVALLAMLPVAAAAWIVAFLVVNYPVEVSAPAFLALWPATMLGFTLWAALCKRLVHPTAAIPDNTDWLGSPGFLLPNRQKDFCFDAKLTYKPTTSLYLQRALIDGLRVLLPGYVIGGIGILSLVVVVAVYKEYGVWGAYTAIPLLTWLAISVCLATVVGLKWLFIGRFRPVVVPLWNVCLVERAYQRSL